MKEKFKLLLDNKINVLYYVAIGVITLAIVLALTITCINLYVIFS